MVSIEYVDRNGLTAWLKLFFSYEIIVAVEKETATHQHRFVSQNQWSQTTGKFLNELQPEKDNRYPYGRILEEVQRGLAEIQ